MAIVLWMCSFAFWVYLWLYNEGLLEGNSSKLPPGKLGLPFFGNTILFVLSPNNPLISQVNKITKTNILFEKTISVIGSQYNGWVFRGENKYLRSFVPRTWSSLLGQNCIITNFGEVHKRQRGLLSQAYSPRALKAYLPFIERISKASLINIVKKRHVQASSFCKEWALVTAASVLLGTEFGGDETRQLMSFFATWVAGFSSVIPFALPFTAFGKAMSARKGLLTICESAINNAKRRGQNENEIVTALDILLSAKDENGKEFSIDELKDQVLLQLFAGHDTSSSVLGSILYYLYMNQQVLQKLESEVQKTFPDKNEPLDYQKLKEMPYLDCVIKEVLRILPPVGGGFRKVVEEQHLGGYLIPKSWQVRFSISMTHHDPSIYPEPEKFDPERFSEARAEDKKAQYSFIPFGGGVRQCLGMELAKLELKAMTVLLARDYKWKVLGEASRSTFPVRRLNYELEIEEKN